jgi:hypothetical protein
MRRFGSLLGVAALVLLLAGPAHGAEQLVMDCPRCDHVDVAGAGLAPNATLTLVIRDVRSGQEVVPETAVTTDGSGSFTREFDMDLNKHPILAGAVYEQDGSQLVLAAHTRTEAPAHCKRAASLPYSGSRAAASAAIAGGLLGVGGLLLLLTRRRARPADA